MSYWKIHVLTFICSSFIFFLIQWSLCHFRFYIVQQLSFVPPVFLSNVLTQLILGSSCTILSKCDVIFVSLCLILYIFLYFCWVRKECFVTSHLLTQSYLYLLKYVIFFYYFTCYIFFIICSNIFYIKILGVDNFK